MQGVQPFGITNNSLEPIPAPAAEAEQPEVEQPEVEQPEVELTIVTMTFDASDQAALAAVLANYVVTSRGEPGCRNIDLCVAVQQGSRFVVIEKWESPAHQQGHFDGAAMVTMAQSCKGLLTAAPTIELLEGISAHDLN